MAERRVESRLLCADLVGIEWIDKAGRQQEAVANLEDISLSGMCLQLDYPIPVRTRVRIEHPNGALFGRVRYCLYREIGYFLGISFDEGSRWSLRLYRPEYLLDPSHFFAPSDHRESS